MSTALLFSFFLAHALVLTRCPCYLQAPANFECPCRCDRCGIYRLALFFRLLQCVLLQEAVLPCVCCMYTPVVGTPSQPRRGVFVRHRAVLLCDVLHAGVASVSERRQREGPTHQPQGGGRRPQPHRR